MDTNDADIINNFIIEKVSKNDAEAINKIMEENGKEGHLSRDQRYIQFTIDPKDPRNFDDILLARHHIKIISGIRCLIIDISLARLENRTRYQVEQRIELPRLVFQKFSYQEALYRLVAMYWKRTTDND